MNESMNKIIKYLNYKLENGFEIIKSTYIMNQYNKCPIL